MANFIYAAFYFISFVKAARFRNHYLSAFVKSLVKVLNCIDALSLPAVSRNRIFSLKINDLHEHFSAEVFF